MDANLLAWFDQLNAELKATIRRRGWSIQYVGGGGCAAPECPCYEDDGPPFAYTIGLFGLGHPELLIFGVDQATAALVLNSVADRVRAGAELMPNQIVEVDEWPHRIVPEVVPNPGEVVFTANDFYARPETASVPVLQLSYDDANGRFPWDDGFLDGDRQPRPGTFKA